MILTKMKVFLLLLAILTMGIYSRALRKRSGIWPDVLALGGNTFAASGDYGMQSYIAYPESGIGYNPYWQGFPQQTQFNNYNPYGYNQPYPYGTGQGIPYAEVGINNGISYMDQGNYYNGYYPSQGGNLGYLPGGIIPGPARFGNVIPRPGSNLGEQTNKPASGNSINI